jgi:acyl carrier protein
LSNNEEKYLSTFASAFSIPVAEVKNELAYQSINEWDSIGHMSLIANLESEFGINIDIDDVIDFSSVAKGKEILQKYGIVF